MTSGPGDRLVARPRRVAATAVVLVALGCTTPPPRAPAGDVAPRLPEPLISADSGISTVIAPGVVRHTLYRGSGPWAIHVLDVDRTACWMPAALKRDSMAIGRATTSALLGRTRGADTVAAVNADFFLFTPPGVPTGAHVDDGRVVTGPGMRPVLAVDSAGRVHFTTLTLRGSAAARGVSLTVSEWNHLPVAGLGVFDDRWGVWTDSTTGSLQVAVGRNGRVLRITRGARRANIPRGGWVLAVKPGSPAAVRRWMAALRVGNAVQIRTALAPLHPLDAVGGFPLLVRDSALAPVLDSAHVRALGAVRHPRTAVGIGRDGRRLLLVVVDGRAPRYSAGMTLPELARLMLELGAQEALNLDGGGSSTMVVREAGGGVQVVNRPSDRGGERPVANAVGVVRGCTR